MPKEQHASTTQKHTMACSASASEGGARHNTKKSAAERSGTGEAQLAGLVGEAQGRPKAPAPSLDPQNSKLDSWLDAKQTKQ